jgi:hypothetical protein
MNEKQFVIKLSNETSLALKHFALDTGMTQALAASWLITNILLEGHLLSVLTRQASRHTEQQKNLTRQETI